jgi:hypothetical protein
LHGESSHDADRVAIQGSQGFYISLDTGTATGVVSGNGHNNWFLHRSNFTGSQRRIISQPVYTTVGCGTGLTDACRGRRSAVYFNAIRRHKFSHVIALPAKPFYSSVKVIFSVMQRILV